MADDGGQRTNTLYVCQLTPCPAAFACAAGANGELTQFLLLADAMAEKPSSEGSRTSSSPRRGRSPAKPGGGGADADEFVQTTVGLNDTAELSMEAITASTRLGAATVFGSPGGEHEG